MRTLDKIRMKVYKWSFKQNFINLRYFIKKQDEKPTTRIKTKLMCCSKFGDKLLRKILFIKLKYNVHHDVKCNNCNNMYYIEQVESSVTKKGKMYFICPNCDRKTYLQKQ